MKRFFHIPTLILHAGLVLTATQTLRHYPDFILWTGAIGLIGHLIYSVHLVRRGTAPLPIFRSHLLGCIVQIFILNRPEFVFTGLGSGLAHFFYQVGLVISLILMALGLFIAYALKKDPTP